MRGKRCIPLYAAHNLCREGLVMNTIIIIQIKSDIISTICYFSGSPWQHEPNCNVLLNARLLSISHTAMFIARKIMRDLFV